MRDREHANSDETTRHRGKGPAPHAPAAADASPALWREPEVEAFRRSLLRFFDEHRRDLPWRDDPNPYAVLVSEVMLQQTRVDTVAPYFERWMERFPTLEALARAETDEVLNVWQGLGYYSRARNLHRAVREVVERYGGRIPDDPSQLLELPGVGPYTAGAVASIAFGVPAPAVDGNVRRVMARLANDPAPTAARLRDWAGTLVAPLRPGDFNQALMELGSLVCTPREPGCGRCPVAGYCAARRAGTQLYRPARKAGRKVPSLDEAVAVLVRRAPGGAREVLLRRRPEGGLLGGMWELPGAVVEKEEAAAVASRLAVSLLVDAPSTELSPKPLEPLRHAFSHRKVRYLPFLFDSLGRGRVRGASVSEGEGARAAVRWVDPSEVADVPLPVAQSTLLSRIR